MFPLLLVLSTLGITVQQIAKKAYNNKIKGGTFTFTALSIIFSLLVFFVTSGGELNFSTELLPYCLSFASAYLAACVFSFMALNTGPISITTLIIQYSLIIPTFYGIIFLKESAKPLLVVGIGLLLISVLLVNLEGKKSDKKLSLRWGILALLSFVGNGVCSTVQKVQQINMQGEFKSEFMIIALLISGLVIGVCAITFEHKDITKKVTTGAHWYIICGLCNGLVNLFVLILSAWPASIVFPVISAGGILATAAIGIFIYKEKLSVQQIVGIILGTASIVFLNL